MVSVVLEPCELAKIVLQRALEWVPVGVGDGGGWGVVGWTSGDGLGTVSVCVDVGVWVCVMFFFVVCEGGGGECMCVSGGSGVLLLLFFVWCFFLEGKQKNR